MFDLHFISAESGFVWYWYNGYGHYLDSLNNRIKFPCTKEQFELCGPICDVEPFTVYLCPAIEEAAFYEDVFIGSGAAAGPDNNTFLLVSNSDETVGRIEIPILSLDEAEICIHTPKGSCV